VGAKRGFSAVEVMVAVMVAAAVGIPLLTLLMQERDTEQRSRFEYLALIAARDEAYESRLMVACGEAANVKHGVTKLENSPLRRLATLFEGGAPNTCDYGPDQLRVTLETALDDPPPGSRLQIGTVTARWVDTELEKKDKRRASLTLQFGAMKPPGVP
jgi:type II secretory pathway pseudopilin PulG